MDDKLKRVEERKKEVFMRVLKLENARSKEIEEVNQHASPALQGLVERMEQLQRKIQEKDLQNLALSRKIKEAKHSPDIKASRANRGQSVKGPALLL